MSSFGKRKTPLQQASGLTRAETRDSLRRFNISAGFRGVFDTVGGGSTFIFVGFACSLGLAKEQLGWLTFLVSSACLVQMAGIPLIRRARNKKRFALTLALSEPLVLIAAVLLAVFLPAPWRLYAFAAAVFVGAAFLQLSRPVTDDWVASTIPAELRGRYLGRRTQILSAAVIAATLAAGWFGERVGMSNTRGLGVIIIVAALCAITAVLVLRDAAMPDLAAESQPHWNDIHTILRTPPFVRLMLLTILYNLPFFLACPYYQAFNLEVARMPATMIAVMQSGYYAVKIVTLPLIGRLVDRWGARRSMLLSGLVYAAFFAAFLVCDAGRYWPLVLAWAVVSLADGAFGLALQSALYASVPETPARPSYFAAYNILTLVLYAAGSAAAVPLLERMKSLQLHVGPFVLGNFHILYGICAALMLVTLFAARLAPGSRGAGTPR